MSARVARVGILGWILFVNRNKQTNSSRQNILWIITAWELSPQLKKHVHISMCPEL